MKLQHENHGFSTIFTTMYVAVNVRKCQILIYLSDERPTRNIHIHIHRLMLIIALENS